MTNESQRTRDAYRIFSSIEGQLILADLEKLFGTNAPAFLQNKAGEFCPLRAAVRDGQRSVILHLLHGHKRATETPPGEAPQRAIRTDIS